MDTALRESLNSPWSETLIDTLLEGTNRAIGRMSRSRSPAPVWYSAAVLCLLIAAAGFGTSAVLGERFPRRLAVMPVEFLALLLSFASLLIFHSATRWVRRVLGHDLVRSMTRAEDVADLQAWLRRLTRRGLHLAFCLVYGITLGLYATASLSRAGFVGFGSTVTFGLVGVTWGIPMYELLVILGLPARLGRYEYRLFLSDPASSQVIGHLSRLLTGLVLLYALVAAGSLLFLAYVGVLPDFGLISVVVAWLPIIVLFASGQYALAGVIARAKAHALAAVQGQIEHLQAGEGLAEKDRLESIGRLWDFHDRIKGTRNAALDLGAVLGFVNSLLLPLISFLLGVL
jgi:hypothetical protein